jgi:hypothetical protein
MMVGFGDGGEEAALQTVGWLIVDSSLEKGVESHLLSSGHRSMRSMGQISEKVFVCRN